MIHADATEHSISFCIHADHNQDARVHVICVPLNAPPDTSATTFTRGLSSNRDVPFNIRSVDQKTANIELSNLVIDQGYRRILWEIEIRSHDFFTPEWVIKNSLNGAANWFKGFSPDSGLERLLGPHKSLADAILSKSLYFCPRRSLK